MARLIFVRTFVYIHTYVCMYIPSVDLCIRILWSCMLTGRNWPSSGHMLFVNTPHLEFAGCIV